LWSDITPIARRDWIHWITSAKHPEARVVVQGRNRLYQLDRHFPRPQITTPRRFRLVLAADEYPRAISRRAHGKHRAKTN
jgi:hypothetical protein